MNRARQRGFILHLALVIAVLTMLWSVAALARVQQQTGGTIHSYHKSEAYYVAKQAASRSLAKMNAEDQNWLADHSGEANADTSTEGAKAWAEKVPGKITLVVEANVAGKKHALTVPILEQIDPSTKLFSLSPSLGGPDVISWATTAAGLWEGLPPVPGATAITCVTVSKNGDVFSVTEGPSSSLLWRYRTGQGWMQMPDLPDDVKLDQISCGGDSNLVAKSSENALMKLPLGSSPEAPMVWEKIPAPTGSTLERVKANPSGTGQTYVTAKAGTQPKIFVQNGTSWDSHAVPSGVTNLDGGLTIDGDGNVFVASNSATPGSPAIIYKRDANAVGSSAGEWQPLAPVPAIEWVGQQGQAPSGNIQTISEIEADPKDGSLWVQWDSPGGANKHNMVQVPTR